MTDAHGEFTIKVEGNIVFLRLSGPMNEYSASDLFVAAKKIITNFNGEKFSLLTNQTNLLGGTPEAYEEANKFNEWLNRQNMVAKAVIITSTTLSKIQSIRIPANKKQNLKEFDNEQDAMEWLKTQL